MASHMGGLAQWVSQRAVTMVAEDLAPGTAWFSFDGEDGWAHLGVARGNGGAGPELAHIPAAPGWSQGSGVWLLSLQYQTSGYPGPHR